MTGRTASYLLHNADETACFAAALGTLLSPGDVILLNGAVGAGKTHFARQLIASLLSEPEDIPSPTFTLVQSYDTGSGPLWHADLYRISSVYEIEELGLTEAFETAICLVEWPDRLGDLAPARALELWLSDGETDRQRHLSVRWTDPRWEALEQIWAEQ